MSIEIDDVVDVYGQVAFFVCTNIQLTEGGVFCPSPAHEQSVSWFSVVFCYFNNMKLRKKNTKQSIYVEWHMLTHSATKVFVKYNFLFYGK